MEVADKRKMTKYDPLQMEIERKGWRCEVLPIEMGCRGYASTALIAYLCGIGLSASELKNTTKELEAAAESLKIRHSPDGPYSCCRVSDHLLC